MTPAEWENKIRAALLGVALGDALGVPVEFTGRETIQQSPLTEMEGFGTHHQPPGTWSDDSSLTFCTAQAIAEGFSIEGMARHFRAWLFNGYWTAHGRVFDVGHATRMAIEKSRMVSSPELAGGTDENSNGNGSLMRILPMLFQVYSLPVEERFAWTRRVSSVTHAHLRSVIACFYYLEFARGLLLGENKNEVYLRLQEDVPVHLNALRINPSEIALFHRLLQQDITQEKPYRIFSSGYVLHTLEASIYCLLTTENWKDAVLKGINMGEDTDTTGAVTGGLAALIYGVDGMPAEWLNKVARKRDIEVLATRMAVQTIV